MSAVAHNRGNRGIVVEPAGALITLSRHFSSFDVPQLHGKPNSVGHNDCFLLEITERVDPN